MSERGSFTWLEELRRAADAVCDEMAGSHPREWCVNWADFHCIQAVWCRANDGEEWAQVALEEASPDLEWDAVRWIQDKLAERGFPDVRVITEW